MLPEWGGRKCPGAQCAEMTTLNFMTYNVHGLNAPIKRNNVIREFKHYKADVVLLQETHISYDSNLKILSTDYPVWYYGDSPIKSAKGIAIGFARGVRFALDRGQSQTRKGDICSRSVK